MTPIERAHAAELHAATLHDADAYLVAADAWEEAGDPAYASVCRIAAKWIRDGRHLVLTLTGRVRGFTWPDWRLHDEEPPHLGIRWHARIDTQPAPPFIIKGDV